MTLEFKRRVRDIDRIWAEYLELLSVCEIALLEKKVLILLIIINCRITRKEYINLCNFSRMSLEINCCKRLHFSNR